MRNFLLPVALGLTAALAAQPNPYTGPVEQRPWHTTISGNAGFTQTVSGQLTGAGYPDVVVLQNGTPHVLSSPGCVNMLQPIASAPSGCTSMATRYLERASSGYRRDQLVVSVGSGLECWTRLPSPGQWGPLASVFTNSNWANLEQLLAADVNGDDIEDMIGLNGSDNSVRVRLVTATGFGAEYTKSFSSPTVVRAITTTLWNDDTAREIAIATSDGLLVCAGNLGSPIATIAGTSNTAAILASARSPHSDTGELLVLAAANGAVWSLFNVTSTAPTAITLGELDLVGCSVGDIDADGDDDLMFTKRSNHRATLFVQHNPTLFTYATVTTLDVPLIGTFANWSASAAPAPTNAAWPTLVDFDGNGAADMCVPVESTKLLAIVRSPFGSARSILVDHNTSSMSGETSGFSLDLGVSLSNPPATATHIETVAWTIGVGDQAHRSYGEVSYWGYERFSIGDTVVHVTGVSEGLPTAGNAIYFQLRPIRVSGDGASAVVEQVWRPTSGLFGAEETYFTPAGKPPVTVQRQDGQYLITFATGCSSYDASFDLPRVDGPAQAGGGRGGLVHQDEIQPARDEARSGSGGVNPATNGGVNTGIIIIVEPPPPPDPPPPGSGGPA